MRVDGFGGVVSLKGYRKAMAYNPITEVEAYWEALRGVRVVPLRSEINPRGIERALDHTFLIESIAPGLARFRLAGQKLNDLMRMEVRGMPLTACIETASRDQVRDALSMLFEGPRVVSLGISLDAGFGRKATQGTLILLPLKSDLGDISRAIGCIAIDPPKGFGAGKRLIVTSLDFREIGPFKTQQPDVQAYQPTPEPTGFKEDPAPFIPATNRADDGKSHLRLVKGKGGDE